MKKLCTLLFLGVLNWANAQGYTELNKLLHRLEQENKINHHTEEHYDLEGKKFLYLKDFQERTERWILEIKDGKSMLVELQDDKKTGKTSSKIYTGDIVRKKHIVSIRADKMEGQLLSIPITYLYHLTYQGGIWYLIDANTGDRWIDTNNLNKKREQKEATKKEKRFLEKIQKRKNKNRE